MKELLKEAKALEPEIIKNRRYLHSHPELGFDLDNTCRFVMEELTSYGYEPKMIYKSGIVATVGDPSKGKTIMLRADMDALPMFEENDLEFKSNIEIAHMCGHDTHTAMLLAAAKLLKAHESELNGCVKLMFQPDEEGTSPDGISGAQRMLEAGVMKNPDVDAIFSIHIISGSYPSGWVAYRKGALLTSCDNFEIKIQGQGAHGSQPYNAVSPINIAAHIYFGLQELIARELPGYEQGSLTAGTFNSGDAPNIIPDTAEISGTIRMTDEVSRTKIKDRMVEMCKKTAEAYGGTCEVSFFNGIPSFYNNPEMTKEVIGYSEELLGRECHEDAYVNTASDDLSILSQLVPSCYIMLGCGDEKEGYCYSHHNPHVLFNEDVMYEGAALHANTAIEWLKNN